MTRHRSAIRDVARKIFHYDTLRPGQEEAIASVLDGNDTLAVMPTGSGKSAIYQISALILDGPTIVVSPLIALQKDQSEHVMRYRAGGAAVVNSLLSEHAQEEALSEAEQGFTQFVFLAPEQFANTERLEAVKAARPALFVVDEAHCISEWGHSFRPDYLRLKTVVEELGHPTVLALTATANPDVRSEIAERLGMRHPKVFVHGFDRPNIWLGVEMAAGESKKRAMLLDRVSHAERPGIVYAGTRKHAEEINDELSALGISSAFYHAGLKKSDREFMQEQFMHDKVDVIVATCAFGMGVDKPNVRFVFHYEAPDSLDSFYQEFGRAGRDGKPATAVLFYRPDDLHLQKFFKGAGQIKQAEVERVLRAIESTGEIEEPELAQKVRFSKNKLARTLNRLQDCGAVELQASGVVRRIAGYRTPQEVALAACEAQGALHQSELDRIEKMREYAELLDCRRAYLLRYFGEDAPDRCGNCDNCQGDGTERARLIAEKKRDADSQIATPEA